MTPKQTILTGNKRAGVEINFVKSTMTVYVSGHYDSYVGIQSEYFHLRDFFDQLGITEAHCRKAFKDKK